MSLNFLGSTMTVKVIIFDFDGTIANTLNAIVDIVNNLSDEYGYKKTNPEELEFLRTLKPLQIIQYSGISIFKLPSLVRKVKSSLSKEIQEINMVTGLKEVLLKLKNQGNQLGIITSNSKENVVLFLEANGLQQVFDFIYSGAPLIGKSKVINSFLKKEHKNPEEVIYVGDETRDIDAARKSHVKIMAVSWGFNSRTALAEQQPDFLIEQPNEILEVIASLQQVALP